MRPKPAPGTEDRELETGGPMPGTGNWRQENGNPEQETGDRKPANLRGQTSIEFLVLLAVTLIVLVIVFAIAAEQLTSMEIGKGNLEARNSVESLKAAANEVYAQGQGARKMVYIKIPHEYDPSASIVSNRTISLNIRDNDISSTTDFDVYGTLPGTEGGHFVAVVSEGSRVRIGSVFLFINKNSLFVSMLQNQTKSDTFMVKNVGGVPINVTLTPAWIHSDVTFTLNDTAFPLDPDEEREIAGTFTASDSAGGEYVGSVEAMGNDSTLIETVALLADAEVLLAPGNDTNVTNVTGNMSFIVVPHTWNQTAPRNQTITKVFSLCTAENVSVASVAFTGSGTAGAWLVPTTAGPIPPDTCIDKSLGLAVPAGAALGLNTGSILAVADGTYNDTVGLSITVLPIDTTPPIITSLDYTPKPAFVDTFLTINANVSDITTGGSNIAYCEIKKGANGTLQNMSPSDGAFDSPLETATFNYPPFGVTAGNNTFFVRCADAGGNVGNFSNISLIMHKEILIILKTVNPTSDEALWIYFVNGQKSQTGYFWSYDIAIAADVNAGTVKTEGYAVLLYADYDGGIGNNNTVKAFNQSGRATLLLGAALKEGPRELGLQSNQGTSLSPGTTLYVMNNSHYITSPFSISTITFYSSAQPTYGLDNTVAGIHLVRDKQNPPKSKRAVVDAPKIIMNGMSTSTAFNSNGTVLAARTVDYAINISKNNVPQ